MPLTAGTRLGPYEILAPLGAGGMGEVYQARDPKLKRDVAIKVLPPALARDSEALVRFEREALSVAALSHPNILSIFDFGTHEGTAYAVTELLEGETLRAKLDAGPIAQKQAVDFAQQVARGLAAAHEGGIVHRDLKPENLFISKEDHVKILDFGLAKRRDFSSVGSDVVTSAPSDSGLTEPGTVMGTAGYMSPEQVRGAAVDHRSDIFSYGAILYEMLSGYRAFKRDTAVETMTAILKEDPPELSESGRSIPVALDRVVRHCLEKDRDHRFQSARDIQFALSEASGPAAATFAAPAISGGRRWKAVAAVVLVALLTAVGVIVFRRFRRDWGAPAVKRVAVLPFENQGAPEDDYFADGIADQIRGKLTLLPGVEVIARASSTSYRKSSKTPQEIGRELDARYLLTATVRWIKSGGVGRVLVSPELVEIRETGAPASKWEEPFDAVLTDVFRVQSDIAARVAEALGVALGEGQQKQLAEKPTQNLAAYDAFLKGEEISNRGLNDRASLRKRVEFYEQAVALDPGFAQAWARVSIDSSLLYNNGAPMPALAERARQAAEKTVALASNRPEGYLALGSYERLVAADDLRALEQYQKGLRLAPGDAAILGAMAITEQGLGRWDAAVEHARQTVHLDPRSVRGSVILGDSLLRLRRFAEAREALDGGLTLAPSNLQVIERKAMTYLGEGDLAGARAVLDAASKDVEPTALVAFVAQYEDLVWALDEPRRDLLLRLTPTAFDDDRATWGLAVAQAYALKNDPANVRLSAEEARKALEEQLRATPDDAGLHAELGIALAYLGRREEAIREGQRAVELQPVAKAARNGPYFQHQLARIYVLVGEPEKALDQWEPLLKIPYYVSPGWLKIDPNFDPLRKSPRFQKLVGGSK